MAKSATIFVCQNCGESVPKWQGQCPQCGQWNTLVEELRPVKVSGGLAGGAKTKAIDPQHITSFLEVGAVKAPKRRLSTGIGELDRVLGGWTTGSEESSSSKKSAKLGRTSASATPSTDTTSANAGMVPGAVMLIGGEPGIGKSTLLTQVVLNIAAQLYTASDEIKPLIYICGEESPSQISLRINRMLSNEQFLSKYNFGKTSPHTMLEHLLFVSSTDVDEITSIIKEKDPSLVVVDSIQTMQTTDLTGAEGSVGQVRESTQRLTDTAKQLSVPMFLVGHVTKEGTIAGPKVLEHIVDTVLELSGERTGELRILRAIKNRFGATDEVGVFRTVEYGLAEVSNPSELFLEHSNQPVPGSATSCVLEGTRPLLVEVQALVVNSQLAMPRRVGRGIELNRIQVLAAVLQKHCHLPLGTTDVFLSAAGGFVIREPAVDLGLAVAMASSLKNKALPTKTLFIGEVGLLGEIRAVTYLDQRVKEAKRLGYTKIISRKTHRYVREVLKELGLV